MQHELRRKDRRLAETETGELLEKGEYGILSTIGSDGEPYGIPLSYCVRGDAIYFHCAVEGRKLENFSQSSRVSFCVVGATQVLPDQFATRYQSVVVSGMISEVFSEEKQLALEGLLAKYSANFIPEGLDYIAAKRDQTKVFRISIDSICGKSRR